MLCSQHIAIQTSHILSAQQPYVASGCHIGLVLKCKLSNLCRAQSPLKRGHGNAAPWHYYKGNELPITILAVRELSAMFSFFCLKGKRCTRSGGRWK